VKAVPWGDPLTHHGEGPVWWPDGRLRLVDLSAGDVLTLGGPAPERRHVGSVAAALRPRRDGGAVIAVERGFALLRDGELTTLPPVWTDPAIRMNDGACAPDGSFWSGTMAYAETPGAGTLYRLDPDLTVTVLLTGLTVANGLDWSPDGTVGYHADTPTGHVYRFDGLDAASRRPFVTIDPADGAPDGLTVDAEGGVWVALWGGSAVRRYDPDGTLTAVVEVGARQVSSCALGEGTLYVTTSREKLAPGDDPLAGCVFRADVGVAGRPVREFAG
jgi:sugar lactone lactonase YvrE